MVRLNRIYTRGGDDGSTSLVGGERVGKDDLRIEAFGTVDELNATIGLCRERNAATGSDSEARVIIDTMLERVQQQLFDLGSGLATRLESRWPGQPVVTADDVVWLETSIDTMNAELEPLRSFVLPGGGPVGAMTHLARTVCRRAERAAFRLSKLEPIAEDDLRYLNRLSDFLFVLGRWVARRHGEPEPLWTPGKRG